MHYAVFRDSLVRFQASLEPLGCKWDVVQELLKPDDESQINSPAFSQPLCTALQLAQIDLLSAWGVKPKSVIGHSSGEIGESIRQPQRCWLTTPSSCRVCDWCHFSRGRCKDSVLARPAVSRCESTTASH